MNLSCENIFTTAANATVRKAHFRNSLKILTGIRGDYSAIWNTAKQRKSGMGLFYSLNIGKTQHPSPAIPVRVPGNRDGFAYPLTLVKYDIGELYEENINNKWSYNKSCITIYRFMVLAYILQNDTKSSLR